MKTPTIYLCCFYNCKEGQVIRIRDDIEIFRSDAENKMSKEEEVEYVGLNKCPERRLLGYPLLLKVIEPFKLSNNTRFSDCEIYAAVAMDEQTEKHLLNISDGRLILLCGARARYSTISNLELLSLLDS